MEKLPKWWPVVTAKVECCTAYPCLSIPNLQFYSIVSYNSLQPENSSEDVVEAKVLLANNTIEPDATYHPMISQGLVLSSYNSYSEETSMGGTTFTNSRGT